MGEATDVGELDEYDDYDVLDDPDLLRPAPPSWHRRTATEMIVSGVLGLDPGYSPVTAVSVSNTAAGAVVLTFGAQTKSPSIGIGPHVAAVDVSTLATGTALWKYKVSGSAVRNAATGQYPIVTNAAGARRIVFRGTASSTFFIGEP